VVNERLVADERQARQALVLKDEELGLVRKEKEQLKDELSRVSLKAEDALTCTQRTFELRVQDANKALDGMHAEVLETRSRLSASERWCNALQGCVPLHAWGPSIDRG
jgi:hypothetical protein